MHLKTLPLIRSAFAVAVFATAAFAQNSQPTDAEKIAKAHADAYVAAFNQGDAAKLGAMYAEDAQYTADDGAAVSGRTAVVDGLASYFKKYKGSKLILKVESARFLTPDVLVEKGLATVDDQTTHYVCNYVKKDGAWLIAELNDTALAPTDAGEVALDELAWMVGSWKDNTPGITVTTTVEWTKHKHFLRRSVNITREDDDPLDATEVIGYDPVTSQIRSWVFDSEGGFGEGTWRRDGNKWLVSFKATAPDGATSSAQHVLTWLDDNKYTWESINRQSQGEVLPNLDKVEIVRGAGE